ncbi:SDR family NAD(P)-dependent oxidoreductase [Curtobacterium sp. MCPF17_002]|uniref:SDR family NAD(P)-dependent oxidoreductase n=1 Tax=Curtobacterium sp. MCPF17_002 TaxID=2175645 RepID=UPI000DA86BB7|nr:SDR family NAD(P)-dependent oxidoreductase [Curtobacterium sp. MCPF17_002]WIB77189.1 SDR family NAD(P)-dependent oxidoreductase [Curtobacterium sp. MCPF17_002]
MDTFEWEPRDLPDQDGRTVVVTGATGGLGLVVAATLAAAGARVVAGVRDLDKAARVLPSTVGLEARLVDTASVASVTAFARRLADDGVVVDTLVNNAGVSASRFALGVDGVERTWATNVVGPAVLADLMLPVLGGPAPRVVLVGSNLSQRSSRVPDLDAVGDPARYRQFAAYTASKTAAAALAVELGERLGASGASGTSGAPVRSVIAHPGIAATGMNGQAETRLAQVAGRIARLAARTPEDGARSTLWAATAPDVEEGGVRRPGPPAIGPAAARRACPWRSGGPGLPCEGPCVRRAGRRTRRGLTRARPVPVSRRTRILEVVSYPLAETRAERWTPRERGAGRVEPSTADWRSSRPEGAPCPFNHPSRRAPARVGGSRSARGSVSS